jgi:hypothetical protein
MLSNRVKKTERFIAANFTTTAGVDRLATVLLEAVRAHADEETTAKVATDFDYLLDPMRAGDLGKSVRRAYERLNSSRH